MNEGNMHIYKVYYILKNFIPPKIQIFLRRIIIKRQLMKTKDIWPVDTSAGKKPEGFNGWPEKKRFAFLFFQWLVTPINDPVVL